MSDGAVQAYEAAGENHLKPLSKRKKTVLIEGVALTAAGWLFLIDCPLGVSVVDQTPMIEVRVATLTDSLLVPEIAIEGFDGHHGRVWVVQDGRLAQLPLIFGHRTEDAQVEVVAGLPDGAQIVASPIQGLAEGRQARISGDVP